MFQRLLNPDETRMQVAGHAIASLQQASHKVRKMFAYRNEDTIAAIKMTARIIVTMILLMQIPPQAFSLEYAGTCRGPSATVTAVEGLDTAHARATANYTMPDAISYCHYSLGRAAGKNNPSAKALSVCVSEFFRDAQSSGPVTAEANCRTGILRTSSHNRSSAYKLPLEPMCGDDNSQAISLFNMLCPSYEGKVTAGE